VQDCYRIYARHKPGQIVSDRVQSWLDDTATSKLVREFAGAPGRLVAMA
jgi:hypothetical protein